MVGLYKDPKGTKTFATKEEVTEDFTSNKNSEIKTLRRRVTELELTLKKHVSYLHTLMFNTAILLIICTQESQTISPKYLPTVVETEEDAAS